MGELLISCSSALDSMKGLLLTADGVARVRRGQFLHDADFESVPETGLAPGERVRLCHDGFLVAVAENGPAHPPQDARNLRLLRVFNEH